MIDEDRDGIEFDEELALALAQSAERDGVAPRPHVRAQLLERIQQAAQQANQRMPLPAGFAFHGANDPAWKLHPVPGIRMKVLSVNRESGYATLLLDVAPGTRFPPHYHSGAEECYVLSGSLFTHNRRMVAGDFLHADAGTDHGEMWTEEGCRVLLIEPPDEAVIGSITP